MAFHSAVHDAFGYLYSYHEIGPGYDYLGTSSLDEDNPMAGQFDGILFWREALKHITTMNEVVRKML